jgi:molybdate transport system permease protein
MGGAEPGLDYAALRLSLELGALTALCLLAIGLPIAYWLAFTGWRFKFLVESVVALPLVLPPTVLGLYVLLAIGPRGPLGRGYELMGGSPLPFSFAGLLIASILYSLPFAVQPFAAAMSSVDRRLIEAAWCLGVSRFATFRRVILPLSMRGIVTGVVLSFAHTLGEFGVVLMVGGSIPGETKTVALAIYDRVQGFDMAGAGLMSAVLLLLSMFAIGITFLTSSRQRRKHGPAA